MVTNQSYGFAYPSVFGLEGYSLPVGDETLQLSEAARLLRGVIDDNARSSYPKKPGIDVMTAIAHGNASQPSTSTGGSHHS